MVGSLGTTSIVVVTAVTLLSPLSGGHVVTGELPAHQISYVVTVYAPLFPVVTL
jgi:hypothetical protein